jgi:uncharacterized coiled-coil DUF342 family protein|tara:strand:- start:865 stop:1110 length:246 start_codon:yes stop_codon:yes gene_type:complete
MLEVNSIIFWNIVLSLVYAPLVYGIRANLSEIKRLDILLSKTREEIPRTYVTKADLHTDLNRLFVRLDKIEDKIDKLAESQ